jgi:ketosteroid isomerase-like protein
MSREENVAILDSYYQALKDADFDRYLGLFADDVMYNVNGSTEVSGRWEGKAALAEQLNPHVFEHIDVSRTVMATKYAVMCADDERVVGIMEAEGTSVDGNPYPQRYCMILAIRDGLIAEVHEFFDTALAETALFGGTLERAGVESMATADFDF